MRRLAAPLTAAALASPAAACPPPLVAYYRPAVVYYSCPPPVVFAPCAVPLVVGPVVTPAAPSAPMPAAPAPKLGAPRVEADPPAPTLPPTRPAAGEDKLPSPFRVVPPEGKPADLPPALPKPNPPLGVPVPGGDGALPKVPDLKPANPGDGGAPPLVLPPPKERTSGSSPVSAAAPAAGGFAVRLVPRAGPAPRSPADPRAVVFSNLSGVDVVLTVAGETAVLPARHELTATVPADFRWQLNGGPERAGRVPPAAPGAEVVIR